MYYNMLLYNFINEGENMSEKEIIKGIIDYLASNNEFFACYSY